LPRLTLELKLLGVSMQVNLIHNSATRKTLEITFPAAVVEKAFVSAINEIAPKAKLPGFRPGKIPRSVLLSKYQNEIIRDVSENSWMPIFGMPQAASA
jgi:trigger factor